MFVFLVERATLAPNAAMKDSTDWPVSSSASVRMEVNAIPPLERASVNQVLLETIRFSILNSHHFFHLQGYIGLLCSETCPDGFFGDNCINVCSCPNKNFQCDPVQGCVCKNGFTGKNCDQIDKEYSAQVEEHKTSGFPFIVFFCVITLVITGVAAFYYRRKFTELKELLYVEYSNYTGSAEPRHFDNPVYASMPSNSNTKLLNNASTSNQLKNTNLIKSKMHFDDLEHERPEAVGNVYETANTNLYVEVDENKLNKDNNFYHTIDEIHESTFKAHHDNGRPSLPTSPLPTSSSSSKCIC